MEKLKIPKYSKELHEQTKWEGNHTHAREASRIVPRVQNAEKITIQVPLLGVGMNSRNQDESTGPPPKPRPTKQRRIINDV